MTMVVGLMSGKEFIVEDNSYLFLNESTGIQTRIFISLDRKRVVTVPSDHIEYFDETLSETFLKDLNESKKVTHNDQENIAMEDVNVR